MTRQKALAERRQHVRFSVEEGALAVLGNPFTTVGRIIDISMGGVEAFHSRMHHLEVDEDPFGP